MKRKKVFKYISNIAFVIGGALGVYAIISSFVVQANLPTGVCPVDNARPFIYVAIGFLALSLITSFFAEKKQRPGDDPPKE